MVIKYKMKQIKTGKRQLFLCTLKKQDIILIELIVLKVLVGGFCLTPWTVNVMLSVGFWLLSAF